MIDIGFSLLWPQQTDVDHGREGIARSSQHPAGRSVVLGRRYDMDPRYNAFAQLWERRRVAEQDRLAREFQRPLRATMGEMLMRLGSRMAGQPLIRQGGHQ
jgi:hypothetical protein